MTPKVIWAHRGASAQAPENTLAAFAMAFEAGADGIELDVHLSRDGVPVVIHDETVDRTTDGTGPVSGLDLAELQNLDAGSWFAPEFRGERIPALEQVLAQFAEHLRINIEVKAADAGQAVCKLLQRYPRTNIIVSSFDRNLLRTLRAWSRDLPLAVLFDQPDWYRALRLAEQLRAVAVHPRVDLVSRPLLQCSHRLSLPVYPWTVDDHQTVRRLLRIGVDGLFTNNPADVIRVAGWIGRR